MVFNSKFNLSSTLPNNIIAKIEECDENDNKYPINSNGFSFIGTNYFLNIYLSFNNLIAIALCDEVGIEISPSNVECPNGLGL
jgi:hypothetical protein